MSLGLAQALKTKLEDQSLRAALLAHGARVCLEGEVYDQEDGPTGTRQRMLPACGPDRASIRLTSEGVAGFLAPTANGDWDSAGEMLLDCVGDSYGFRPAVVSVEELWLWPDDGSGAR